MPTIELLTTRFGGPTNWAYALAKAAQATHYDVHVHHRAARTILSPLWTSADLVHTVLPIPWHLWKRPMLLTVKGDYTRERSIWRAFYPRVISLADRVTVPSEFLRTTLDLPNARVIPNAVDVDSYPVCSAQKRPTLEILTVTKFWFPGKARGVVHMATILRDAMSSAQTPYHLTVLGEGPYLSSVREQVAALGIPATFTGAANPRHYFSKADVFAYYSLHDNMPNAILEAMASGLPIVSNAIGAVPEMLTDGIDGYVAKSDASYMQALRVLADDISRRALIGSAARHTAERKFDWTVILPQFVAQYDALLQK